MDEPEKKLRHIIKYGHHDGYNCNEHSNDSLRIVGHPEGQIPVQERGTIFVEIASALRHQKFRIDLSGKFTDLLKKPRAAVCLRDCKSKEIDNCRVHSLAHHQDIGCCDKSC